jgi:hypothetical protein
MTRRESGAGFQVNQNLTFQKRDWTAQRIGWVIMLLLVIAALAGLFGHGALGDAQVGHPGGLRLEYERLTRHGSSSFLKVHLPAVAGPGELRLWLDRRYADRVRFESIVPEPERVELSADRLAYTFTLGPGEQSPHLMFDITPTALWSATARLGIEGGETLTFSQFVYP